MLSISEFLRQKQHLLISACALYLTLVMVPQLPLAGPHIWLIAAAFSIFVNLTYLAKTHGRRAPLGPETLIASVLICGGVLGLVTSPALIVVTIFVQGIWHLIRRLQHGVPLKSLNTLGCFVVETSYGLVLLVLFLR